MTGTTSQDSQQNQLFSQGKMDRPSMVLLETQRATHDPRFVLARLYRRAVRSKHKCIV